MVTVTYSILSGLSAFVFISLLCKETEAFGWWDSFLRVRLFGYGKVNGKKIPYHVDFDDMTPLQLTIYKPLAGCAKCCAGWLSILVYLLGALKFDKFIFDLFNMPFFIVGAVFSAWLLDGLKRKYFD